MVERRAIQESLAPPLSQTSRHTNGRTFVYGVQQAPYMADLPVGGFRTCDPPATRTLPLGHRLMRLQGWRFLKLSRFLQVISNLDLERHACRKYSHSHYFISV
ncbi:hypothetical protein AVEN_77855-1 [Araneus ventricosus]|uniref:Uncharacterized protein n=1 Tax=Araneus ventricosus TaxID=182803 RepID=A0A4Y2Q436_ARAVE|nr:hypothetical protein AVEN_77855-1 [Araneus ventricosus]